MLSRLVMNRGLLRGASRMSRVYKPGNHVCFCGCGDSNHQDGLMSQTKRNFQGHLGLDSTVDLVPAEFKASDQVSLWKDVKAK